MSNGQKPPNGESESDALDKPGSHDLVGEFFFDVIRRVIPGLAIATLYAHTVGITSVSLKDFPGIFAICIPLGSWLIGTVIEMVFVVPLDEWLRKQKKADPNCKWANVLLRRAWEHDADNITARGRQVYKVYAEKVMFRSFALIFFITFLFPPDITSNITWSRWGGLCGAAISAYLYRWLSTRLDEANQRRKALEEVKAFALEKESRRLQLRNADLEKIIEVAKRDKKPFAAEQAEVDTNSGRLFAIGAAMQKIKIGHPEFVDPLLVKNFTDGLRAAAANEPDPAAKKKLIEHAGWIDQQLR